MKKLITIFVLVIVCLLTVSCNAGGEGSPFFPVQKAGLEQMEALLEGKLEMDDGYLRVKYFDDNYLLIWPYGFSLHTEGDEIQIIDRDGQIVARVGDTVTVGGGETTAEVVEKAIGRRLPDDCEGPCWLVGEFIEANSPSSEGTSEKYAEIFEKYKDNPELIDAAIYAEEQGVSVDEAVRRFELMDEAGPLGAALEQNEADTFAGCWIEHTPEFKLVIVFTRNGEETIKKYVKEDSPLAKVIELRTLGVTYEELQAAQRETMQLLDELGLFCDTDINIQESQVEVYVTDNKLFNETLQEANAQLPAHVIAIVIYEPLYEIPFEIDPDPSVHFPQLKMRSGSFMQVCMVGELVLKDGYLRVDGTLIIWQPDYFVHNNEGTIEILDRNGEVVARVGEEVVMGGGGIPLEYVNRLIKEPLPEDCQGPFFLQGSETRLSLNFSSDLFGLEVITSGEDKAYFLKRKPLLDESARQEITLTGSLVASYNGVLTRYPHIRVEAKPEENKGIVSYTTFWPADYTARINNGIFEIMDGAGRVVLCDGEEADIEGKVIYGYFEQLHNELPGGYSGPYLIVDRVLGSEE